MTTETITFDDNAKIAELCGPHDTHLMLIERRLGVEILPRGNTVTLKGEEGARAEARTVLEALYKRLQTGLPLSLPEVEAALRLQNDGTGKVSTGDLTLTLPRRSITPRTPAQAHYMQALKDNELVFGVGPAGTGKT